MTISVLFVASRGVSLKWGLPSRAFVELSRSCFLRLCLVYPAASCVSASPTVFFWECTPSYIPCTHVSISLSVFEVSNLRQERERVKNEEGEGGGGQAKCDVSILRPWLLAQKPPRDADTPKPPWTPFTEIWDTMLLPGVLKCQEGRRPGNWSSASLFHGLLWKIAKLLRTTIPWRGFLSQDSHKARKSCKFQRVAWQLLPVSYIYILQISQSTLGAGWYFFFSSLLF